MSNKIQYKWDPTDYAAHSSGQFTWAQELIDKLNLGGDESILDLGCGDGKVTALLAGQVPDGSVIGVDSSTSMVALARERFPPSTNPNLTFKVMDATYLTFQNQFDIVFSNAVLHWIPDHLAVLKGIYHSLRPGGNALLQMGGKGNAAGILAVLNQLMFQDAWRPYFQNFILPYSFYGLEEYGRWLPLSGLTTLRVELIPKMMAHHGEDALAGWIRTTWLPYLERLPTGLRETFISQLVESYVNLNPADDHGLIYVQMVRLEVHARRPRP